MIDCVHPFTRLLGCVLLGLAAAGSSGADGPALVDVAADAGIDFVYYNGMSGEQYAIEVMGGGLALFDYDNDGDLDLYLVQGGTVIGPDKTAEDALFPPPSPGPVTDRLLRNDSILAASGDGTMRFVDVTERSRIDSVGYGMGIASGDYDDDGWIDLYVTNFGSNALLRNNGDGTFTDRTATARVDDTGWSVPATFEDFDGDGRVDLYVGNYLFWRYSFHRKCRNITGADDYCGPRAYNGAADRLFRNLGDGTFDDATEASAMVALPGGALGAVARDFNGDDLPDLYVANDMTPNFLWINQGDGTFREDALLAGAAVNWEGLPEASMGTAVADYDGDGDQDLFLTHLLGESNTLYVNEGDGLFSDRTLPSGLADSSLAYTSFGTGWFDYDNDGDLDLLVVSGAVRLNAQLVSTDDPYPLDQPNQLFENVEGRFRDVTTDSSPDLAISEVSRGTAFGDLDNDGRTDVVILNSNGPLRLLRNVDDGGARWLGIRGAEATGTGVTGLAVVAETGDGAKLHRLSSTDGSFGAASDPRITVGTGEATLRRVRLTRRSGPSIDWRSPPAGVYANFPATASP